MLARAASFTNAGLNVAEAPKASWDEQGRCAMTTVAATVTPIAWWKEPTKDQWYAYVAAWAGWTLDAFDFTRTAAQDLCQGIGEGPWLGKLDDVAVGHGVSLLHWRSGGVEHHHDTPPYPIVPSPTSGHNSPSTRSVHLPEQLGEVAPRLDLGD
jgi:hypothetical protein